MNPNDPVAALRQTQLAYEMAHQLCQFKGGFLARVSHELRSPLNSLIGVHQLILADLCDDPAEERELIGQAHAAALKLMQLLDQILEVAKLEHGTVPLELQPLELGAVLQEVEQLTRLPAQNRNLRLQVSLPDVASTEIAYVLADPRWLRQVLVSFVDASIYTMSEGKIHLSTQLTPETETAVISIEMELPFSTWETGNTWEPRVPALEVTQATKASNFEDSNPSKRLTPGMLRLMNQLVLERMGGSLNFVDLGAATRIQCTIPLVVPEAES